MSKPQKNKEKPLRFEALEVKGVRDVGDQVLVVEDDAEAEFFALYGKTNEYTYCLGDFSTRDGAEFIKAAIESG
jgi:hypothetical protein